MSRDEHSARQRAHRSWVFFFGMVLSAAVFALGGAIPASAGECTPQTIEMYADGVGSAPVMKEELRDELGEDVKFCAYSLDQDAVEALSDKCVVRSITFEGSKPAPRLITVVNGWNELAVHAEVKRLSGDLAWMWNTDSGGCAEEGCLEGGPFQIRLSDRGVGLTDGVETCPWTLVQARFVMEP